MIVRAPWASISYEGLILNLGWPTGNIVLLKSIFNLPEILFINIRLWVRLTCWVEGLAIAKLSHTMWQLEIYIIQDSYEYASLPILPNESGQTTMNRISCWHIWCDLLLEIFVPLGFWDTCCHLSKLVLIKRIQVPPQCLHVALIPELFAWYEQTTAFWANKSSAL